VDSAMNIAERQTARLRQKKCERVSQMVLYSAVCVNGFEWAASREGVGC